MGKVDIGGIQIQSAIGAAIGRLGTLGGTKPVSIVAAFPAHFPHIAGDGPVFHEILTGLFAHAVSNTERVEVRVRAQLIPAGKLSVPNTIRSHDVAIGSGPWALISISDDQGSPAKSMSSTPEGLPSKGKVPTFVECQRLVQTLGGYIWSEEQVDSSFKIWMAMPLKATVQADTDLTQIRKAVETHLPEGEPSGISILLFVEDESLGELLTLELVAEGYRVVLCQEASEVLSLAMGERPELVILDLQAREPTAFELARFIKGDPNLVRIPILFLTAIVDPKGGTQLGTAGYLLRAEGTGAMLATVGTALSSGVPPSARVLVVEPNETQREQMIVHIQASGHPVVEAGSAEEAVALAERTRIGLVLANTDVAHARDYWFIRQIKSLDPGIEVYVLGESLSDEAGRAAVLRGASGFGDTGRLPDLLKKIGEDRQESEKKT